MTAHNKHGVARKRVKKGHKSAGTANKTDGSLVKVVVKADDTGEWVKPNTLDKFYIDSEAVFPSIEFEIKTEVAGPYKWSWLIAWDAHVSGLREKPRGSKVASFSEKGEFTQDSKTWNAKSINKVVGGRLVVTVEVGGTKFRRTVLVLGKQPSAEKIKAYLEARDATALEKLVAQESKFKHFINLDSEPVVAGDKGYGLTQLTKPVPKYSQIWSWKENLDAGIALVAEKKAAAKKFLDTHGANSYTQDMLDLETISRWNGGSYHEWNTTDKKWQRKQNILCDSKTGNMGWNTDVPENKDKTESDLRDRDKDEYKKMKAGQTADHPWIYTGVCYADHVTGK
ncbi:hypothetical protein C798_24070 [Herbaspirillum rubrisubalbicans Os34]|jgi:hypothetical protein|uniref:Uncharacterized protein n=1 Tax=Herbaspirillum rubrisubalbicans Os34 TaxID=1235827 RepID=A0A6M3ZXC3_9BURK|nr:hypothetical protein [Herbaspirillum rubrisubalbicans]QJQ03196.1 hypothetical protein C798_24070 [Herbaspirillum rubrisubalbicans Os34]